MTRTQTFRLFLMTLLASFILTASSPSVSLALEDGDAAKADEEKKDDFPPLEKVVKDFEEVESEDGEKTFFKLWKNEDTGRILARLPKNYASSKARQFIAPTVSGGELFAGLQ